jgi:hypothetical protein
MLKFTLHLLKFQKNNDPSSINKKTYAITITKS